MKMQANHGAGKMRKVANKNVFFLIYLATIVVESKDRVTIEEELKD